MPHRRPLLDACRVTAAMLFSLAACSPTGMLTVFADGSAAGQPLEVFAIPIDPLLLPTSAASSPAHAAAGTPRGDSIVRLRALEDSARNADERFQRQRAELNEEAREIGSLDRLSAEYASRYDAHRARLVEAERVRSARDRLRDRAAELRARLGASAPLGPAMHNAGERTAGRREALREASDGHRRARIIAAPGAGVTLALEGGTWWIGVAPPDGAPVGFTEVTITPAGRDTIRIEEWSAGSGSRGQSR